MLTSSIYKAKTRNVDSRMSQYHCAGEEEQKEEGPVWLDTADGNETSSSPSIVDRFILFTNKIPIHAFAIVTKQYIACSAACCHVLWPQWSRRVVSVPLRVPGALSSMPLFPPASPDTAHLSLPGMVSLSQRHYWRIISRLLRAAARPPRRNRAKSGPASVPSRTRNPGRKQ